MLVLPSSGRRESSPARTLLLGHRSYRLIRQSRVALLDFGFLASFVESLQVATSPCCYRDSPDVISANPSPDAWSPAPTVPPSAFTCFFLGVIGLPQSTMGRLPVLFRERDFPRASFRGCRHFVMFRVAVGTTVTRCPPHSPVLAQLAHTVLTLDVWRRSAR